MRWTLTAWYALIVVSVFSALSAVAGGVAVIPNWIGLPPSMLDGSPFDSYVVPGLVLLLVVGGTQVVATVQLFMRRPSALLWAAVAGFAMIIWIVVETAIIRGFSVLQGIYLGTGIAQVALVVALLGVVSWMPRVPWATRAAP